MNPNYVHTITLYNRIKAADAKDGKERWIKTILRNCFYKVQTSTSFGDIQANVSNIYIVRIPEDRRYLPYAEFVKNPKGRFTVSLDDIVIRGACDEDIAGTSGQAAIQVLQKHKPDAFKVTAFSDNTAFRMAKHYRLGG